MEKLVSCVFLKGALDGSGWIGIRHVVSPCNIMIKCLKPCLFFSHFYWSFI